VNITVDVRSGVPPFEQIRTQIATFVTTGLLAAGTRLPTIRALAADLGVAAGTVARAYSELETAGLVTSRRRTGTVVAERTSAPVGDGVRAAAEVLAARAHAGGLGEETVVALVRAAFAPRAEAEERGNLAPQPPGTHFGM
jgi:GntR family transcriptional regulator